MNKFKLKVLGKDVVIIPWICLVVGDAVGNNDLFERYNRGNICYLYWNCSVI